MSGSDVIMKVIYAMIAIFTFTAIASTLNTQIGTALSGSVFSSLGSLIVPAAIIVASMTIIKAAR